MQPLVISIWNGPQKRYLLRSLLFSVFRFFFVPHVLLAISIALAWKLNCWEFGILEHLSWKKRRLYHTPTHKLQRSKWVAMHACHVVGLSLYVGLSAKCIELVFRQPTHQQTLICLMGLLSKNSYTLNQGGKNFHQKNYWYSMQLLSLFNIKFQKLYIRKIYKMEGCVRA